MAGFFGDLVGPGVQEGLTASPQLVPGVSQVAQRKQITLDPQPDDDPGRDRAQVGMAPKLLARMDVGDVHFDQRRP